MSVVPKKKEIGTAGGLKSRDSRTRSLKIDWQYRLEVANPRGDVRGVIPEKADY